MLSLALQCLYLFLEGSYFWLVLSGSAHSIIPRLESEPKAFFFNFHNAFLLSKIVHLIKYLSVPLPFPFTFQNTKLHQAKMYALDLQTPECPDPFPILDFCSLSEFVKTLFVVKQQLDGIWLEIQAYTNSHIPTGTSRQKTHKEKYQW